MLFCFYTGFSRGASAVEIQVLAPAMSGHPEFDRIFRVQMNTLEWMPIFLPLLWLFAFYVSDVAAAVLGLVWIAARILYVVRYTEAASQRGPGFHLQAASASCCSSARLPASSIVSHTADDAARFANQGKNRMAPHRPIDYADASPEVRAVFDDIKHSRQIKDVNNFWKYLAHDPATLKRTWESIKQIMAPGALDAVTKEMVYLAVSVTNGCGYCIASHGAAARKAGMSEAMFGELMAVVGMANETNRLANGYRVPIDPAFEK